METAIIIPCHSKSSRLPRKLYLNVGGKSLLQTVYEQANKNKWADVWIAAADDEILRFASGFSDSIVRVEGSTNGSHAVALANKQLNYNICINWQADFLNLREVDLTRIYRRCVFNADTNSIYTGHYKKEKTVKPSAVKTVLSHDNKAIYYSRFSVPHGSEYSLIHCGFYIFWAKTLMDIFNSNLTDYHSKCEELEQNHFIDLGYSIFSYECQETVSVDTLEDYERVKND